MARPGPSNVDRNQGIYQRRAQPVTDGELAAACAANEMHDSWTMSGYGYGSVPETQPGMHSSGRIPDAGRLGSMGSIGDCFDNSVAEAYFSRLQRELLDQHDWHSRDQLAAAMFGWIECWYNPHRRRG